MCTRLFSFSRQIALTINDRKAYTKPWTVTLNQVIVLDTELLDYMTSDGVKRRRVKRP